jgi:hypothetical protein
MWVQKSSVNDKPIKKAPSTYDPRSEVAPDTLITAKHVIIRSPNARMNIIPKDEGKSMILYDVAGSYGGRYVSERGTLSPKYVVLQGMDSPLLAAHACYSAPERKQMMHIITGDRYLITASPGYLSYIFVSDHDAFDFDLGIVTTIAGTAAAPGNRNTLCHYKGNSLEEKSTFIGAIDPPQVDLPGILVTTSPDGKTRRIIDLYRGIEIDFKLNFPSFSVLHTTPWYMLVESFAPAVVTTPPTPEGPSELIRFTWVEPEPIKCALCDEKISPAGDASIEVSPGKDSHREGYIGEEVFPTGTYALSCGHMVLAHERCVVMGDRCKAGCKYVGSIKLRG